MALRAWVIVLLAVMAWAGQAVADEPATAPGQEPAAPPAPADAPPATETAPAPAADDAQRKRDEEYYELYKVLADTLDQVERNYVKEVDRRELMEAAIRGVIDKLDPYSNYINPGELGSFKTSVESQFGGIGIQVDVTLDGRLVVVSPLVGSPAYRAGLQSGDWIVEIEGQPSEGLALDEVIRRLKGEAGTSVTITIVHPRSTERQKVTIGRETIQLDTVLGDERDDQDRWDFMLDDEKKIGYIRLTAFSRDTGRHLEEALKTLEKQQLQGLVLDLRFNPGGLLASAVEISDLFIPEGRIVSTAGRNSREKKWDARKPGTFEGFPMAVLVNRYSASASEIVSACLQDHKRAIVIGERTWGKGSVQNVIELENGKSALKLTTASYQRPSGHNIHRFPDSKETDEWGVIPDAGYELRLSDSELTELVMYRRDRDILLINHFGASKPDAVGEAPPAPDSAETKDAPAEAPAEGTEPAAASGSAQEDGFVDRQLQKAVEYLSNELANAS